MNQWEWYVRNNPDLIAHWEQNGGNNWMPMNEFGKTHYAEYGNREPRNLPENFNPGGAANYVPPAQGSAPLSALVPTVNHQTPAYTPATTPPPAPQGGGNYNQGQTSSQAGMFQTVGQMNQAQQQSTQQNTNQTTQQQQNTAQQTGQTQNTAQQQTGQTQTSGTSTNQQYGQQNTNQQQNTAQQSVGQSSTAGSQTQQQTGQEQSTQDLTARTQGTTSTSGTNTSQAIDSLGFGQLLRDSAGSVQQTDAVRQGYLSDLVQTGGSAFNSQVDQAIRNSQSGPGMLGVGDSARARSSGYAAAQIARNNTQERLAASQQLAGPTGLATLSTAANPYVGRTDTTNQTQNVDQTTRTQGTTGTTSSGTTTGTSQANQFNSSNQTGQMTGSQGTSSATSGSQTNNQTQNSISNLLGSMSGSGFSNTQQGTTGSMQSSMAGLSNLLNSQSEVNSGSTTAQSSQVAAGQIPEGQPMKTGGGCVLCTAAIELGLSRHHRVLRQVIAYKLGPGWSSFRRAAYGYFFLFTPLAYWLLKHPRIAATLWPMAKAVVYEELRVSGRNLPRNRWASAVHWAGHYLCAAVGYLPVPRRVTNPVILSIAQRENILFNVKN